MVAVGGAHTWLHLDPLGQGEDGAERRGRKAGTVAEEVGGENGSCLQLLRLIPWRVPLRTSSKSNSGTNSKVTICPSFFFCCWRKIP